MAILVGGQPSFLGQLGSGLGGGISSGIEDVLKLRNELKREQAQGAQNLQLANLLGVQFTPEQQQQFTSAGSAGQKAFLEQQVRSQQPPKLGVFETESEKLAAKRVGEFVGLVSEEAQGAERILESVSDVNKSFDSGNVGFGTARNITRTILGKVGIPIPENADEATVEAAGIAFLEKAKPLFGRVTEGEVNILRQAVPSINDSVEGARAKAAIWEKGARLGIKRQELVQQIINENGGIAPRNIESLVTDALSEERQALIAEAKAIGQGDFSANAQEIPDGFIEISINGQEGFVSPGQLENMKSQGLNPLIKNQKQEQPQPRSVVPSQLPQQATPQQAPEGAFEAIRNQPRQQAIGGGPNINRESVLNAFQNARSGVAGTQDILRGILGI